MWFLYALLSAITAALVAIFGKMGLQDGTDPVSATTVRSIIMAGFLVVISFYYGKFRSFALPEFDTKNWLLIIAASISGALSWLFYFIALKMGDATKVVVVDRLSLVFVLFLSAIFLGELLTGKALVGAALMVAGALLVSW